MDANSVTVTERFVKYLGGKGEMIYLLEGCQAIALHMERCSLCCPLKQQDR